MTRRDWLTHVLIGGVALRAGRVRAAHRQGTRAADGDPTALSAAALGEAIAAHRWSPIEVTAAYLSRIDREDPALGAFVTVARDRAVDDARRVTRSLMAGTLRGPLAGVPIAHKDLVDTAGIRTTGGSRLYLDRVPERDADLVARLAAAGTVLLGKTNTHELGGGVTTVNPFTGTTRNPRDRARIPGGSSGGSAAAVVARLCAAATGSDTGGSVRIPAALCGCVGLKPAFGAVSTAGILGASPTFDHAGVLARTVRDAALVLDAIAEAGTDLAGAVARRPADLRGLRVGVPRGYFCEGLADEVRAGFDRALAAWAGGGARTSDVDLIDTAVRALRVARGPAAAVPATPRAVFDALFEDMFAPIVGAEIHARYGQAFRDRPDAFSPAFAAAFGAPPPDAPVVARAHQARAAFEAGVAAALSGVDVLAMPTVPIPAPPIAGPIDGALILRNTWPINAARVPAVSVPCPGGDPAALPTGLQIVAAAGAEATLLRAAAFLEPA